ncbi:MAG: outer membrane beta-barrel protein [Bacteroidia bacterium]
MDFIYTSFLFPTDLIAQINYHLALKAGANLFQINGDNYNCYNIIGFNGGVFFNMGLSKKITGQLEMFYPQKGCINYFDLPNDIRVNECRLRYFVFPILFQYHIKKN